MHMHRCLTIVSETGDNARCLQVNASLRIAYDRQCSVHHAHARHYSNEKATSIFPPTWYPKYSRNYGGALIAPSHPCKSATQPRGRLFRHEFPPSSLPLLSMVSRAGHTRITLPLSSIPHMLHLPHDTTALLGLPRMVKNIDWIELRSTQSAEEANSGARVMCRSQGRGIHAHRLL